MSASPSKTTTAERAGPPVHAAASDQKLHPLVRLTSMYGSFVLEAVGQWVMTDQARLEEETPDSLEYLTESMRFLMDAVERQQRMGELCRLIGGGQKNSLMQLEATYPVLKECGIDTSAMEARAETIRTTSRVLEAFAAAHSGNADQVALILNSLEVRIHAVLHVGQPGSKPLSN
jgi:hypothetical protein